MAHGDRDPCPPIEQPVGDTSPEPVSVELCQFRFHGKRGLGPSDVKDTYLQLRPSGFRVGERVDDLPFGARELRGSLKVFQ